MWQTTFSLILLSATVDQQLETHLVQVNRYFGFKVVPAVVGISYNVNVLYSIDFTKYCGTEKMCRRWTTSGYYCPGTIVGIVIMSMFTNAALK